MKKVVVSGKTVADAVRLGLTQLGVAEDRVQVTVLEQPVKGFFGLIGAKDAKVEVEKLPDPLEEAEIFLQDVCSTMNLAVKVERTETAEGLTFNLTGPELGMLIGRRGQTLDALQYLVNIVANRYSDTHLKIILDAEQFRERRRKTLEDLARRLADRVVRTRKEMVLEPMPPQERKVIHSYLQTHHAVKTFSKGEEPNRRIVITLR
ncbi:RNA-binding cell elongation regulator Jag/EloR [Gorillibacterium massiliense]|uniref:RNA-binding cell elongation regulator Jag/EloR n=1 Tax=Gorillibacterium massiliense TaxID=1280390 RepID=UPI0004B582DA|nr:RNA-binding cell elongation regulator Jag/EloR [Gorillibacterium massiliense]